MKKLINFILLSLALVSVSAAAAEKYKPFVLAYTTDGEMSAVVAEVREKLTAGGFEVVGSYSPYPTATIVAFTSDAIKEQAAASEFGGYGAAARASVTEVDGELQVAYTNPTYMAHAYRMDGDMSDVSLQLASVLGAEKEYGLQSGMDADDLREYHYMFGMEYFDEPSVLAEYDSQAEALDVVEAKLAEGVSGVTKVYRVDLPGKKESVFGVAMRGDEDNQAMDDQFIMSEIDFKPVRSTPHLPYEMLVSDGKVYALYARFRIAINFPDLSMMGDNSFMNIMDSPDAIEDALKLAAGTEPKQSEWE